MKNRGFTLVELLGVIMVLSIVLAIAVGSFSKYLSGSRNKAFKLAINSFEDAVLTAYNDCEARNPNTSFCNNHRIPASGKSDTIELSELINAGYIENIKNPYKTSELCNAASSSVVVTRDNVSDNISLSYNTCLVCGTKRSTGCN